jgi:geranylgeranyl reductase family protein
LGLGTEIAIIGAGPAGARAAYVLARRGARVTIYDGSHPREKPCGGGVTGRALSLVADAIDPAAFPQTRIRSARFTASQTSPPSAHSFGDCHADAPEAQQRVVPLDGDALVIASRAAFDAALLDAAARAGAVVERVRVTNVTVDACAAEIETTAGRRRAAFVIGADGANSLVRRRLAEPFRRDQLSIAAGFFAHGVTSDEIVIELIADPPGYIWSFPRPDHLAIGVCAQADGAATAAALRAQAARWIAATRIAAGARLVPYSWPIPSLNAHDLGALQVAGSRWALVGDAAGLVDPITREGIYFALRSGDDAAESLLSGTSPGPHYARRVRDGIHDELRRAARFKARFYRARFMGLLVGALEGSAGIRDVMVDLVGGRQSYRGLKRRLLGTLEWRLMWDVLGSR